MFFFFFKIKIQFFFAAFCRHNQYFRIHHFLHSASYKAHIFNDVLAAEEARAKAEAKAERLRKQAQKHLISFSYFFFWLYPDIDCLIFFSACKYLGEERRS